MFSYLLINRLSKYNYKDTKKQKICLWTLPLLVKKKEKLQLIDRRKMSSATPGRRQILTPLLISANTTE